MSIPASYDTLMRQAPATAHLYMLEGLTEIDKLFGKGYAKEHPDLLGFFMLTSAIDLLGATFGKEIGEAIGSVGASIASDEH
jgi:hypothetical protein